MRTEIKRIQKRLGISTIFVTHDQEEALSLGDVIAVMKDGEVQQVGTSHDIYHHPANFFVATFIGSPPLNCLTCQVQTADGALTLVSQAFRLPVASARVASSLRARGEVVMGIRPEFIVIAPERPDTVAARVALIEPLGSRTIIILEAEGVELQALVQGETAAREGETVHLRLDLERRFSPTRPATNCDDADCLAVCTRYHSPLEGESARQGRSPPARRWGVSAGCGCRAEMDISRPVSPHPNPPPQGGRGLGAN